MVLYYDILHSQLVMCRFNNSFFLLLGSPLSGLVRVCGVKIIAYEITYELYKIPTTRVSHLPSCEEWMCSNLQMDEFQNVKNTEIDTEIPSFVKKSNYQHFHK